MVNQAFKEFIIERAGAEAWQQIARMAAESGDDYLPMRQYDDTQTYSLVGRSCEHLKEQADTLLQDFGGYWVQFALRSSYKNLLLSSGNNLFATLRALDKMHYQIARTMTGLKPPSFRVKDIDDRQVYLYYQSSRAGLEAFVRGLILGLGRLYSVSPIVTVYEPRRATDGVVTFLVQIP